MNNISQFLDKANANPDTVTFQETVTVIDANYTFTPTAFKNGNHFNNANENNCSCKIFAFAKVN